MTTNQLNHTPAEIISQWLIVNSQAQHPKEADDWSQFIGILPEARPENKVPINASCVYDVAGLTDGKIHRTKKTTVHPGINVQVRSEDRNLGWRHSTHLFNKLDGIKRETIKLPDDGDYLIHGCRMTTTIIPLGFQQEGNYYLFSLNLITTITVQE